MPGQVPWALAGGDAPLHGAVRGAVGACLQHVSRLHMLRA